MIKLLRRGQQSRPLCLGLGKPTFAPLSVIEMDLGSFMKVVYMGVIFILALV